jgi:hypothetical protein
MSAYLVTSIQREGRNRNPTKENTWLRSFCLGAAVRIFERVDFLLKESAQQRGTGTSLVLASIYQTEQLENKKLMDEEFPPDNRTQGRKGKQDGNPEAFEDGQEYANTLGLNRQLGTEKRPQLERKR